MFARSTPAKPTAEPRQPTHRVYRVSGQGKEASWTPIGAAWSNQDGKGFNLMLDALPIGGRIVARLITAGDPQRRLV